MFVLQAGELERIDQEITLSLQGMGLSLVNNHIQKEVAYMAITRWRQSALFSALKVVSKSFRARFHSSSVLISVTVVKTL